MRVAHIFRFLAAALESLLANCSQETSPANLQTQSLDSSVIADRLPMQVWSLLIKRTAQRMEGHDQKRQRLHRFTKKGRATQWR
jgi:hypothetical protein